jgi:hypothetical protein
MDSIAPNVKNEPSQEPADKQDNNNNINYISHDYRTGEPPYCLIILFPGE